MLNLVSVGVFLGPGGVVIAGSLRGLPCRRMRVVVFGLVSAGLPYGLKQAAVDLPLSGRHAADIPEDRTQGLSLWTAPSLV